MIPITKPIARISSHNWFYPIVVIVAGFFALLPLTEPHFFASSDGPFYLFRLVEYDAALRAGIWYPRWAPDFFLGLGMPLFNYYAPLTCYVAEAFHLLGAGYIESLRIVAALFMLGAGISAFVYVRLYTSPVAASLGAIVYMYIPYHLINAYYRGDLAEYAAYLWYPLILWAFAQTIRKKSIGYALVGSVCYGGLILTHNLSALIFSCFLVIYVLAMLIQSDGRLYMRSRDSWKSILRVVGAVGLGLGVTSFFWFPAFVEKSLVNFDRLSKHYNFHDYFPSPDQLVSLDIIHKYGMVFNASGSNGYQLGILQAAFLIVALLLLVWRFPSIEPSLRRELPVSLIVTVIAICFILPFSLPLWERLPLLNLAQFPWRFLAFAGLPSALAAGFIVDQIRPRFVHYGVAVLIPIVIASSVYGMAPVVTNIQESDLSPKGSIEFELTYAAIGTSAAAEYLPTVIKEHPYVTGPALAAVLEGEIPALAYPVEGIAVEQQVRKPGNSAYKVTANNADEIVFNVLNFPGWTATIDGQSTDILTDEQSGLIALKVPAGEHTINLRFGETKKRLAADLFSGACFLLMIGMAFYVGRRESFPSPSLPRLQLDKGFWIGSGLVLLLLLGWFAAKHFYNTNYYEFTTPGKPLVAELRNGLRISSYTLGSSERSEQSQKAFQPGATLALSIYWLPPAGGSADQYETYALLTNVFGQTWAYTEPSQTSITETGQKKRTDFRMDIPKGTAPGVYQIEICFRDVNSKKILTPDKVQIAPLLPGIKGVRIGPIVVGRATTSGPTQLGDKQNLAAPGDFGEYMRLLDFALSDDEAARTGRPGKPLERGVEAGSWKLNAGESVHLDLLWQALKTPSNNLVITARIIDADGRYWSVRDSQPADGFSPTSLWTSGQSVRDQMNIAVPAEIPPGSYKLELAVIEWSVPLQVKTDNLQQKTTSLQLGSIYVMPSVRMTDAQKVTVQHQNTIPLLDNLSMLGYGLSRPEAEPGEALQVDVVWLALKEIPSDLSVDLALIDSEGQTQAEWKGKLTGEVYPTSKWRQGEIIRGRYTLNIPPATPDGNLHLAVRLTDNNDQHLKELELTTINVQGPKRVFSATPKIPLVKEYPNGISLVGYNLSTDNSEGDDKGITTRPGDTLAVVPYWRTTTTVTKNYTVFVQILNSEGKLVAQNDAMPQSGKRPTTSWISNEIVIDEHDVGLPANLPAGNYTIICGMYDATSGKRLSLADGSDHLKLASLQIR
jgi:hypothetical protein